MAEAGIVAIHAALYLVAFFWFLGFIPIQMRFGDKPGEPYSRKRDIVSAAAFLLWMFAGFALFQWLIPAPFNPFFS